MPVRATGIFVFFFFKSAAAQPNVTQTHPRPPGWPYGA
jgi:hypothetical protein